MAAYGVDVVVAPGVVERTHRYAPINGSPIDWDGDGHIGFTSQDLNFWGPDSPIRETRQPSFPEILTGHHDWEALVYLHDRASSDLVDGIHATSTRLTELTVAELEAFGALPPPNRNDLTSLSPAKVWIGLKNSDAVGLRLDLKAEVYLTAAKIGEGQLTNVASGSSAFNNAQLNTIPLTLTAPVEVPANASLKLTLLGAPNLYWWGAQLRHPAAVVQR
jgi:hypothetical protein